MLVNFPGKDGKRSYIANEIPNLNNKIYKTENNGTELGEYYLNVVICEKIADYIRKHNPNIVVIESYATNSSEDLNAAGRIAITHNPDMYLSIHHNCTDKTKDNARGYVCITANGSFSNESEDVAENISKYLTDSYTKSGLPIWSGKKDGVWKDTSYIGELNIATNFCPAVLVEVGFFNNLEDLKIVTDDEKTDIIAESIAKCILDEFHKGTFDNDQNNETTQDSTKFQIIDSNEEEKKKISDDNKCKNNLKSVTKTHSAVNTIKNILNRNKGR